VGAQIAVRLYARDPISRAGLEAALRWHPDIELLDSESIEPPRVAIVAVDSLDEPALRLMRSLQAQGGVAVTLVVNALTDAELLAAVEAGTCAVIWRFEATASWLAEIVTKVAAGEAALPADVLARLLKQISRLQHHVLSPMGMGLNGLSAREIDVLRLAAEGLDTGAIARKLSYSKRTVTNVFHDITNRYQLSNRAHAVAFAIREGLI
jgi:DNA-binding NarL/FixJ family response regulator